MGKTFEALERAKKESSENIPDVSKESPDREIESLTEKAKQEYRDDTPGISKEPQEKEVTASAELVLNPTAMECCYELKTNLLTRDSDETIRSILFVGTSPGDGSSTLAVNYATLLSQDTGRMVLLIDLNGVNIHSHEASKTDRPQVPTDDDIGVEEEVFQVKKVGPGNLYFLVFGRENVKYTEFFESDRIDRFLKMVYKRFDYLIMAAPSVSGSSKARAFCAKVDGVVMVILSGKTRRQIAIKAKEGMEDAGGKLLGVVLNRRKYYIPESIYRRL